MPPTLVGTSLDVGGGAVSSGSVTCTFAMTSGSVSTGTVACGNVNSTGTVTDTLDVRQRLGQPDDQQQQRPGQQRPRGAGGEPERPVFLSRDSGAASSSCSTTKLC